MHPKRYVPWYVKLGAKLLFSRLPVPQRAWRALGLFTHGEMDEPEYAIEVFDSHLRLLRPKPDFTLLELGPGDSIGTALLCKAYGGSRSILVDVGEFATQDLDFYRALSRLLRQRGLPSPELDDVTSLSDVLRRCDAVYMTNGLDALRSIPDSSVDHAFSQAVVEHIPLPEVEASFRELRRILREDGSSSHTIDLRDHLGGALHSLRFSQERWESSLFRSSGFYTNRLRFSELLDLFGRCGFDVAVARTRRWKSIPTRRNALARPFQSLSDEDLMVATFACVLTPRAAELRERLPHEGTGG